MIRCALAISLLIFVYDSFAQVTQFGVQVDGNRVGSFGLNTEYNGEQTTTFSNLGIQLLTLEDTIDFQQKVIYQESCRHGLQSINSTVVFEDTLYHHYVLQYDSIPRSIGKDTIYIADTSFIYGPEAIRLLSLRTLDSIGASVCYKTFVPELGQVAQIKRTIIGQRIDRAEKVWMIKESINDQPISIGKYNGTFHLLELSANSNFGKIEIRPYRRIDSIDQFIPIEFFNKSLESNSYLPDPLNINALELSLIASDTTIDYTLTDNSFTPTPKDSILRIDYLEQIKWIGFQDSDSVKQLLRSIRFQRDAYISKMNKLHKLASEASSNHKFNNLKLLQYCRSVGIPSRLVSGYRYEYGYWESAIWVEAGIDEEWVPFDASGNISINRALRIPVSYSMVKNSLFKFSVDPFRITDSTKIVVKEYLLGGRSTKLKKPNYPSYQFKNDRYINHALKFSFEIPEGFSRNDSSISTESNEVISFKNESGEIISIEQYVSKNAHKTLVKQITAYTGISESSNYLKSKFDKAVYEQKENRFAAGYLMGDSFLLIKIESKNVSKLRTFLFKKNFKISN